MSVKVAAEISHKKLALDSGLKSAGGVNTMRQ
jgi:hypothetical protein